MAIDLLEQILPHIKDSIYPVRKALPDWRMKEGNIPDAESATLKDRSWTSIRIPFHWGKYDKTYWFRQTINIEPEFAGKPLVLLLDFPDALLYLNGKPFQGIDQHHREVLIREKSKLNEQLFLAIQAYSGKKQEHTTFSFSELAVLDTTARRLASGLTVLQEVDKLMEHGSQESREIRELIRRTLVFLKYFKPGSEEYPNAIRRAYNFLLNTLETEFKTTLPGLVHLIGYSQISTAWLWTLQEALRKSARTFSNVFRLMEEFPEFEFSQSQPVLYELIKINYPDLYKQIKQRVTENKLEPLGPMWTEADCNIPNGESLIRQILFGNKFYKKEFGVESNILWLPNSFGFNAALPQILAKSGISYFYTSKLSWNDTTKFPYTSFWWQGIDKTKILAHISPLGLEAQITPKFILKSGNPEQQQASSSHTLQTYGYGNGEGGPTKESLEFAIVLKTIIGLPTSQLSTVQKFFRQLQEQSENLPTWNNELYLETHRGTYTTHGWIKKENRECEILLYISELLSTIAMTFGKNAASRLYPTKELEQAWKKLLINQSCNIITGTSTGDVYKDAHQDYQDIRRICSTEINRCIQGISQPIQKGKKEFHFTLFNSLGWQRNEYVELFVKSTEKYFSIWESPPATQTGVSKKGKDHSGNSFESSGHDSTNTLIAHQVVERTKHGQKLLCFVKNIPAMGFKHIVVRVDQKPINPSLPWKTSSQGIETPYYRARLDRKGEFSSIYAKFLHRELFQKGKRGNYFATFRDIPKQWEAWNIDAEYEKHKIEVWNFKRVKIIEQGPLRAVIRIEFRTSNGSVLLQDIRFYHQSPQIDFQTYIRWHEKQTLMKVAFPFNMKTSSATYEIPLGALSRSSKPRTEEETAKFEVPAQQWADMSDAKYGISLLNDCKYGYAAQENTLQLTLLRSSHYPNPIEPWYPDEELTDQGDHTFCYALYPHSGDWIKGNTVRHARGFNNPILVFPNLRVERIPSLAVSSKSNIIIDSIKKAEETDSIIVRMHEAHGIPTDTTIHFGLNTANAIECDLLENDQKQYKIIKSKLLLKFKPFEIKTIKLTVKAQKKKQ
jgi:alpha-mannosidase